MSILHTFTGGTTDGCTATGGVVLDSSGNIYGTTQIGGTGPCVASSGGCGTIFELKKSGSSYTESTLYSFQDGTDGATPNGQLAMLTFPDFGNLVRIHLFGTTQIGGDNTNYTNGCGVVYEAIIANVGVSFSMNVLREFAGSTTDGAMPMGGVYFSPDGSTLVGTTELGGGSSNGTAFEIYGPAHTENIVHSFDCTSTTDGCEPLGTLTGDSNGNLFGVTPRGAGDKGIVFELARSATTGAYTFSTVYQFQGGSSDGDTPTPAAALYAGTLYIATQFGGSNGGGSTCDGDSCGTIVSMTK
jgi:hypothetical protein